MSRFHLFQKINTVTLAVFTVAAIAGCSETSADMQERYVDASIHAEQAIKISESYKEALVSYEKALDHVGAILEDKSSREARDLVSGEMKLGGLPLSVFMSKEDDLRRLAKAEEELFEAALLSASKIEKSIPKAKATLSLYKTNMDGGGYEVLMEALNETYEPSKKMWLLSALIISDVNNEKYSRAANYLSEAFRVANDPELYLGGDLATVSIIRDISSHLHNEPRGGEVSTALIEAAMRIDDIKYRVPAEIAIAKMIAEQGDKAEAVSMLKDTAKQMGYLVDSSSNSWDNDDLLELQSGFLLIDDIEAATVIARQFSHDRDSLEAYLNVARHHIEEENLNKGKAILDQVSLKFIRGSGDFSSIRKDALYVNLKNSSDLAKAYAYGGFEQEATEIHEIISEMARNYELWVDMEYIYYMKDMVLEFSNSGKYDSALSFYVNLIKFSENKIYGLRYEGEKSADKASAFIKVARSLANDQTMEFGMRSFSRALKNISKMESRGGVAWSLGELASLQRDFPNLKMRGDDYDILREIVHKAQPMNAFW